MVIASNLGFPRIGPRRELKKALESYWSESLSEGELLSVASSLRRQNWNLQKETGLDHIPSNDFSLYDHVLDTAAMLGAVPSRFGPSNGSVDLGTYFAMARGKETDGRGIAAMEMTKWFDTNYHYIVPEFEPDQTFRPAWTKPLDEFLEAQALGFHTRPVLLGPVSFLLLGKFKKGAPCFALLLENLIEVYEYFLDRLANAGADWVQLDEPCLVVDLEPEVLQSYRRAYTRLARVSSRLNLLVATYFSDLRENSSLAFSLPVAALHLDLVRGPDQLETALSEIPESMALSLGLIDGRNVWRTDLENALAIVNKAVHTLGDERVMVAPSCSLLHSPVDLDLEQGLDGELRAWLAFAKQKLEEVVLLTRAIREGPQAAEELLSENRETMRRKRTSTRIHNPRVKQRVSQVRPDMLRRGKGYPERRNLQRNLLRLPLLPTTTIGSFPQTKEVRVARSNHRTGKISRQQYEDFIRSEIKRTIQFQEEIGLDVLVHGEFERSDMVEYFGEQMSGLVSTESGWVQSYGSRCVKPPIIYGDLERKQSMTVEWWEYAQSLTPKPVKGMLTGPVTILQWSFVRDDQPRAQTCRQIALAIRDEVLDLEAAGARVIQIDEPAIREGLPLRRNDQPEYLRWAIEAFRLASSGVKDETQIHTHMCYSEFNDIIDAVTAMDADVLSIESSRSQLDLLDVFARHRYPNEIGPGVYDVHSPRVPSCEEIQSLLEKIMEVLSSGQIWVNPDCGLKTRRWEEVRPALTAMVEAARNLRSELRERESVKPCT